MNVHTPLFVPRPPARPDRVQLVRTLVVDGSDVVRTGLVHLLRRIGASVVGEVTTAADAAADAVRIHADLVIVGDLVGDSISDLVRVLKSVSPGTRVVHLAVSTPREEYVALLKAGVDAIAPLAATADALADVLTRVLDGERVLGRTALLAVRPSLAATGGSEVQLSAREHEVLLLLASTRTLAEIAGELYLSKSTVRSHTARIYKKLAASSRQQALERAVALGLLR
jgi:DNA-binding NarL/FixJ family response regulator